MLDRIEFLLSEALISLRRNTWMTFAAVTTSAMALFIIGGIGFAYTSLANYGKSLESKFDIKVFAKLNASEDQILSLEKKLKALDGVKEVIFQTKQEAWVEWKKQNPTLSENVVEIENPLPDTFTVTFTEISAAKGVVDQVKTFPEVDPKDGVLYMDTEHDFLAKALSALRWIGIVLGGLMFMTGAVLIFNTVRLTMLNRRREIGIMEMVGATRQTIVTPLLLEGVMHGMMGGVLATLVLWLAHTVVVRLVRFVSALVQDAQFPMFSTMLILCLVGAVYGFVCSAIALRKPGLEEAIR